MATERTQALCDEHGVTLWLFNDESVYRRASNYWQRTDFSVRRTMIKHCVEAA